MPSVEDEPMASTRTGSRRAHVRLGQGEAHPLRRRRQRSRARRRGTGRSEVTGDDGRRQAGSRPSETGAS